MGNSARIRGMAKRVVPAAGVVVVLGLCIAFFGPILRGHARNNSPSVAVKKQPTEQMQTFEGMITDTRCGAKHSAAIGLTAADCTRACVHGGEQFSLIEGDKVYVLEGDLPVLKQSAGRRAKVAGTLTGNKIAVSSVRTDS